MLLGEVGNPRTGKTLMNFKITKNIADTNPDMKFFLNYPPENPDAKYKNVVNPYKKRMMYPMTPALLLKLRLPYEHAGTVCIDELWKWLMARGSGGAEINKVIMVLVFESGKRGFDINWDSQLSSSIDRYVRMMTDRFFYSLTPSQRYFRYGYVSSSYHGGKKVIRLRLSKATAEENYYPYFNTLFSPKFATKENTPTMNEVQQSDTNIQNDLSKEIFKDLDVEQTPPSDIPLEIEKKDREAIGIFTEENDAFLKELTGKTIIDGADLIKQTKEIRKDVIEEGEPLP